MPAKAICCGEESVLVSIYVERPRRRASSTSNRHYHGRHRHHVHIKESLLHQHKVGGGYNRRADLLLYSQQLREDARSRSVAARPAHQSSDASNSPQHTTKIITVRRTRKYLRTPTCDWKRLLIPHFLRSWMGHQKKKEKKKKKRHSSQSVSNKMNAIINTLHVQKKWDFVTKLFSTRRRR